MVYGFFFFANVICKKHFDTGDLMNRSEHDNEDLRLHHQFSVFFKNFLSRATLGRSHAAVSTAVLLLFICWGSALLLTAC